MLYYKNNKSNKSQIKSFEDIFILDSDGQIIASTNIASLSTDHSNDEFFVKGNNQNVVTVFFKDQKGNLRLYLTDPLIL
jgi:hypothetical protein